MSARLRFPIRFKILITILIVTTSVVSIITFTMANLFHTDKTAYIHDLTSEMTMHTAAETRSLLVGYVEKLEIYTRVMFERDLFQDQKSKLLGQLFEDFQEFVAVTVYENRKESATIYDAKTLTEAGLTKEELFASRTNNPLPWDRLQANEVYIKNSTLLPNFPTFTLAVSRLIPDSSQETVVAAEIRLDGLLDLTRRSQVFTSFITDHDGNLLAHSDIQKVIQHDQVKWIPEIKSLQNQQSYGITREFLANDILMVGGLANVSFNGLLAGIELPKTAAYLTSRELLNNLIGVSLALLIGSAVLGLFCARYLTRPLEQLSKATNAVGKGNFEVQLPASSRDEIGDLADSFNQMAVELNSREMALKEAQTALIQSEKMAAFGQLGAGIAHEVKNPLAGILGLTQLSLRKTEENTPLSKNLTMIETETKRCKTVIENLLKFARQEKVTFERIEINQVVEEATAIVAHQLGINHIKIDKQLDSNLPQVTGNVNQISQVLLNLMINAQQAMEGKPGVVRVTTQRHNATHVELRVRDTGSGIPKDLLAKVFEPFFTTKPVGKGTGLGLSVSYGIIKEHKGDIRVASSLGKGTIFAITLPVASSGNA